MNSAFSQNKVILNCNSTKQNYSTILLWKLKEETTARQQFKIEIEVGKKSAKKKIPKRRMTFTSLIFCLRSGKILIMRKIIFFFFAGNIKIGKIPGYKKVVYTEFSI